MDAPIPDSQFPEFNLDPALAETVETAPAEQLIEGILRLENPTQVPPHFSVVSRFNRICTGRFLAAHAWTIRRHPNALSLKAARPLGVSYDGEDLTAPALPGETGIPPRSPAPFEGRGCIVAALDFGLDFAHPNFLNPDGTTRLVSFWHQGAPYDAAHPNRYGYGRVFSRAEIDAALRAPDPYQALGYHPAISDTSNGSHGTHTLDIAAGNGRARGARASPAANADLMFIHLSTPRYGVVGDLGDSVRMLEALDHVERTARGRPWVVNLSVGRTAGSHDGTSLVEQGMHELLRLGPGRAIVQSAGNYRSANLAVQGWLRDGEHRDLKWIVDPEDTTDNEVDVWYSGKDRFVIAIRPPQGSAFVEVKLGDVADIVHEGAVVGRLYHRRRDPNNGDNHGEVFLHPGAPAGVWTLRLIGAYVISGRFHAWIERDLARPGAQSRFDARITSQSYTLGTIATSPLVITVGAYDANALGAPVAPFSSQGPTRDERPDKPEVLAPGVDVIAARSIPFGARRQEGLLVARSGTSMAAPHVTGTVAAMFEAAGRPVSIDEIRDGLKRSARPLEGGECGDCWGRLDTAAAIRSMAPSREPDARAPVRSPPTPGPRVFDAATDYFPMAPEEQPTGMRLDEGESLMSSDAPDNFLDRAELALRNSDRDRRASETSFLQQLLRELGGQVFAPGLTPAGLFRATVNDGPPTQSAKRLLKVVALPSKRPADVLQAGDWMLRAVPGTGDVGHVSVLASADLLTPSELESEGIAAESRRPGQYGLVIEAGAFPHSRSRRFARLVFDSRGRVPPHTVIVRPQYPGAGASAELPHDEPEGTQRAAAVQAPELLQQFEAAGHAPEEEATQALSVLVVDEHVQPLVDCHYAIYQGERSERGQFAKGGKGLAAFQTIDPTQPFLFEVRDRVCAIYSGAFIDPDDPAIEYGGTWFDWTLVRDNRKEADTSFWPHYRRAREQALHGEGSPRGVDSFWQHEHIVRRPIRAIESAGGRRQVTIQAIPARIRTGPIVRYTDHQRASVWLEPTTPSMVRLRVKLAGGREAEKTAYASTVRVGGRHFAIVEIDGLQPDTFYQYTLDLAPLPARGAIPVDPGDFGSVFPEITPGVRQAMRQQLTKASVEQIEWLSFRTLRASYDKSLRFATGSCRWYPGDDIEEGGKKKSWEPDMLDRLGEWLRKTPRPRWPHFQFYGGDQIYADEIGEAHHAELIRARFASRVPGPQDPNTSVADRLIDGAWAGRFAHRLKPLKPPTGPAGDVSNNVTSGLKDLATLYREHPVLRLIAGGRVTEKQLHAQYETRRTRRRDVQGATREADDEREAREAINALPRLKRLLVAVEPYRVYVPYWSHRQRAGVANPPAYGYRSCNFLLWKLPEAETDLPTLQDQTRGDRGVRGEGDRGHPSADGGRHAADFAEYAFLHERAWTTSPNVRALLGNVPTFLMFDDHEVTDDWNFDASWVRMIHSRLDHYRMWPKTITDALCAYWVYQGLGNKARSHWQRDRDPRAEVLDRAQRAGVDALPELRKCIYRAVMAAPPADAKAPFQTGLSLDWHYSLPFEPPFLVPDCRTRKRLVPKDEAMKQIDHQRDPPQSETIDARQIKWLQDALAGCKAPVAFIAPSTPLLMQKAVLKIMSQPESYARAWLRDIEGETKVGLALALLAGGASLAQIRSFRVVKDLEHMIRDKSWRDLWALVETMHRSRTSPVKTIVLVSGDVHHSYCMTGSLSGRGRPFPELLQITSSGLKTTIRRDTEKAIAEGLSNLSFNFAGRHLVPGFMSRAGSRRRELALYKNAVAIVDVRLGAEVGVRVTHLAGEDERKVDEYVYEYTSGPSYMRMGEPANTPYRLEPPAEEGEGWSAGVAESRAVIDEAALDWQEDEPTADEDGSLDEGGIGVPFEPHPEYPQDTGLRDAPVEQAPQARFRTVFDDESDEYDLLDSVSVEAEQSIHEDEAGALDEAYALADEAEQWLPGDDTMAEDEVKATVSIASIQFAFSGNTNVHAMYLAANSHPLLPGVSLDWWARGAKITDPEWINGRSGKDNKCAVVTRNKPVRMRVQLKCSTPVDVSGTLTATPRLDGSTKYLKDASVAFTYPSGAASHAVDIELASTMPDEVGRFQLQVRWAATGGVSFSKMTTTHCLYSAYGPPLEPDYDSADPADTGVPTSGGDGTLTGTRRRLDKLTELLGSARRVPAKTAEDLIELLWKLHVGINDTPGAPPYFDAGHSKFLTTDGESDGTIVPIDDQWLAWLLTRSPHWNDASCIGHVQLLKTMAAAVGIFVRRTWVFPTTKTLPDKSTPALADTDCFSLGSRDSSKTQKWTFTHDGKTFEAEPKLMEPDLSWENFEACMLTSQGRFLTGGYSTSSNPRSFTTDRGFRSAKELLRWWCNTKRPRFGKRFMAWVSENLATFETHFWDVDGKHYDAPDYVKIRDTGKELPPP